jgi:phage baseplate assembly protein W
MSLRLPFAPDRVHGLQMCRSEDESISQSIRMILSTRPGTRPLEPGYGCRLHEFLFRPLTPSFRSAVTFFVESALAEWEKRIVLTSVEIEAGKEPGSVVLVVKYRTSQRNETKALTMTMERGEVQFLD